MRVNLTTDAIPVNVFRIDFDRVVRVGNGAVIIVFGRISLPANRVSSGALKIYLDPLNFIACELVHIWPPSSGTKSD